MYLMQGACIVNVISPQAFSMEAWRTGTTLVPLQQVLAHCLREARSCFHALVHRHTAIGATPISTHPTRTRSTFKLSIGEFLAGYLLVEAWVTIVSARI